MAVAGRTPEEVRSSIEANRLGLTRSVRDLQVKVREVADWRGHLRKNPTLSIGAAAGAGFLVGGGIGAVLGLVLRR